MPNVVRVDSATRAYQLGAYTSSGTGAVQAWASDPNAARSPVNGIVLQVPDPTVVAANATGTWVEYGGADLTPGNGLVLKPGDSALLNEPNAAAIWIVTSVAGMNVRAQIR